MPDLPRHIAMIMDGNGRWAQARGLSRGEGHRVGSEVSRTIIEECAKIGIEFLTLYCFSSENWKRPLDEQNALMELLRFYLIAERPRLQQNNIRLKIIGRREGIPPQVCAEMDKSIAETANNSGMTLCLAINYGARAEIVDACKTVAREIARGEYSLDEITEEKIAAALYTADFPDPDLLIRTGGEMRISNYLLWQLSYAEFWSTPTFWPDFTTTNLHQALDDFQTRERRFGGM